MHMYDIIGKHCRLIKPLGSHTSYNRHGRQKRLKVDMHR